MSLEPGNLEVISEHEIFQVLKPCSQHLGREGSREETKWALQFRSLSGTIHTWKRNHVDHQRRNFIKTRLPAGEAMGEEAPGLHFTEA